MALPGFDLCAFPAAAPPKGEVSNFVDPTSSESTMIAVSTILLSLSQPLVLVRIWVNRRKLNVGDYFFIICAVWNIPFTALLLTQAKFGRHQWDVPACWFDGEHMKIIFLICLLFGFISFGRAAILLMYRQLFRISRTTHITIWIGLVFNFLIYVPSIPIAVYYETPRLGQTWQDVLYEVSKLKNVMVPYGIATGVAAFVMDVYIFILPLPVVLRLRLSRAKKLQAVAVFATAFLAVLASIIALVYRVALGPNFTTDSTWSIHCFFISLVVENNIVLIVASMPAFASFFRQYIAESTVYKSLLHALSVSSASSSRGFDSATESAKKHHYYNHLRPKPFDSNVSSNEQPTQEDQSFPMPVLRPLGVGMSVTGQKMKQQQSAAASVSFYHELDEDSLYCGKSSRTTTRICSDGSEVKKGHGAGFIAKTTSIITKSEPQRGRDDFGGPCS